MIKQAAFLIAGLMLAAAVRMDAEGVKEYDISIVGVERVLEYKDLFGTNRPKSEADEVFVVKAKIISAVKVILTGISATGADGTTYKCEYKQVEHHPSETAKGKSTFDQSFPFVVPKGASVVSMNIEGVDLKIPVFRNPSLKKAVTKKP